jgi:transposase-like protein
MIISTIACPHCNKPENVVKYGTTEIGTQRAKCKDCNKTFAINPKSRAVTPEKEAAILRQFEERTTIRGICRTLQCGTQTVYATLKKVESLPPFKETVLPVYKRNIQPERWGDSIECDEICPRYQPWFGLL